MKQFELADVKRLPGKMLKAALIDPVVITENGEEKLVVLTAAHYRGLAVRSPHSAYTVEDAPDNVHAELMAGLESLSR